ncbi:hypothetical protein ACJIZ3_017880 [Penstemon smallii]|uniref:PWI domain-containing protein n=1 Tax=Penstemon smallii TaxID=265156 RepID=A0ABD3SXZ2_9LAMI
MSGGFFRGTSADQDTRFSNKQSKLLKSQKFAPELENLVDMTKVKMDVMKPWIAKRVTDLIGFEDEVLINFIYGLLEGKAVNGKQLQISITGFMERNTGKFMKELWALLLSAQQNLSGVPQQFLDAKEEETKKKSEADRLANEIRRNKEKEKQELDQEKTKMDGDGEMLRDKHAMLELNVKHDPIQPTNEKDQHKRNGPSERSRGSLSSDSSRRSLSPSDRRRSRSISRTPPLRSRHFSSERRRSLPRRSLTPRRRHTIRHSPSPLRHRSLHSKRRSMSRTQQRSPSPARHRVRSPWRYRSRSPLHRRSRSPMRRRLRPPTRRSPARYKSRSPLQHRSPSPSRGRSTSPVRRISSSLMRHRSPSPVRRRSPSPLRRRSPSPLRRRSPSPLHRRSPSPLRRRPLYLRRRSPTPVRGRYRRSPSTPRPRSISPVQKTSSMHYQKISLTTNIQRSLSPQDSSSPSPLHHSSLSPTRRRSPRKSTRSAQQSPVQRVRSHEYSPAHRASPNERAELLPKNRNGSKVMDHKPIVSLRSPQRDVRHPCDLPGKESDSSPYKQKSPLPSNASRDKIYSGQRSTSPDHRRGRMIHPESPRSLQKSSVHKLRRDTSGTSADDEDNFSRRVIGAKYRSSEKISPTPVRHTVLIDSAEIHGPGNGPKLRKTQLTNRHNDRKPDKVDQIEHRERQELSTIHENTAFSEKERESYDDRGRAIDKNRAQADDSYQSLEPEKIPNLSRKSENNQNGSTGSPSKETDEHRIKVKEKRKHKKLDREDADSDDFTSYDSSEERREAKRRRKEEKKMKKEKRRRRREDKHKRRRAEKLKLKSGDGSSSSDVERDHSEDENVQRLDSRTGDIPKTESEQKKLEIELREKALETLRAKKGIGN